jgi:hypothetical protein
VRLSLGSVLQSVKSRENIAADWTESAFQDNTWDALCNEPAPATGTPPCALCGRHPSTAWLLRSNSPNLGFE